MIIINWVLFNFDKEEMRWGEKQIHQGSVCFLALKRMFIFDVRVYFDIVDLAENRVSGNIDNHYGRCCLTFSLELFFDSLVNNT